MNYIITGKGFTSPLLQKLNSEPSFRMISEEELKASNIIFDYKDKVYAPDESSVETIKNKFKDAEKSNQIDSIKDKYKCRELIKHLYPNLFFTTIKLADLPEFKIGDNRKYVVKPKKGFFGTGVEIIDNKSNLTEIMLKIRADLDKNSQVFSKDVFSGEEMIIEDFIQGEEFTVDMYYDEKGKPVIVNLDHHPESKNADYFHLLYYTAKELFSNHYDQIIEIFETLNKTLGAKNIPIHAEFKYSNNQLIPIEFNIPRYGGFGLADLPYYAFNSNSFLHFFNGTSPDWNSILKENKDYYGWVLCYNPKDLDSNKYEPNYKKIKKRLNGLLHFYELDYRTKPVFGIGYIKLADRKELFDLLNIEFKEYFSIIQN